MHLANIVNFLPTLALPDISETDDVTLIWRISTVHDTTLDFHMKLICSELILNQRIKILLGRLASHSLFFAFSKIALEIKDQRTWSPERPLHLKLPNNRKLALLCSTGCPKTLN